MKPADVFVSSPGQTGENTMADLSCSGLRKRRYFILIRNLNQCRDAPAVNTALLSYVNRIGFFNQFAKAFNNAFLGQFLIADIALGVAANDFEIVCFSQ